MSRFYPNKLKGKLHYHACSRCRHRYWDHCTDVEHDQVCRSCVTSYLSLAEIGTQPRACCVTDCRPATGDDRTLYRLVGPGPWFLCRTCARQFGYQPS